MIFEGFFEFVFTFRQIVPWTILIIYDKIFELLDYSNIPIRAKSDRLQNLTYDLKIDDVLYFLHIPKTAGMSLVSILDNYFEYDSILVERTWQELVPTIPRDFAKYRLIRGHFGYSIHRILPKKPIFMTMLRDPIERTISDYEHMVRDPVSDELTDFFAKKNTIVDFLNNDGLNWRLTNNQIRHIGLDKDISVQPYSFVKTGLGTVSTTMSIEYKSEDDPSDEKLLEISKQRLREFPFFGITERFNESILLFAYTFGFIPNINLNRKNVAPYKQQKNTIPEDMLDLLLNCTNLDRELYTYGKEIFDYRFTKMIHELEEKYDDHRIENLPLQEKLVELLKKNYDNQHKNIFRHDFIEYDFRQQLQGSGWEAREFTPDGTAFRWTGPENTSTIYFALERNKNKKLRFSISFVLTPTTLESLKVKVDGNNVNLMEFPRYRNKHVFEAIIPKIEDHRRQFTEITFQVDYTTSPNSINANSTDSRLLGIAIDWIRIL